MRTVMLLAAVVAVFVVVVLAACRARDDSAADSTVDDSARADGSAIDSVAAADPGSVSSSVPLEKPSRPNKRATRRAEDPAPPDTTLIPEDSLRAMRPKLPQVEPPVKRPGTWRGLKLPEERPVRLPIETIRRVEPAPDSEPKSDSSKPPKPDR